VAEIGSVTMHTKPRSHLRQEPLASLGYAHGAAAALQLNKQINPRAKEAYSIFRCSWNFLEFVGD